MITATPSVALKNVPGFHHWQTKLPRVPSHGTPFCLSFWQTYASRVEFFVFVLSSGYNSLNSQSVYTRGIYVRSATRSEKQYWHSDLSEWMSVCEWLTDGEKEKKNQRWNEVRMMGVVCEEVGSLHGNDPRNNLSFQRWHPLSGRSKQKE